jgi:cytochrome P450
VVSFATPPRGRTGVVDMMAEYTDPIPNAVISRVTGIAAKSGEEVRFRQLAQATIRGFFSFADPEVKQRGGEAFLEIAEWVRRLADERRRTPREDMITDLVRARDRGDAMHDDEIVTLLAGSRFRSCGATAIGAPVSMLFPASHTLAR